MNSTQRCHRKPTDWLIESPLAPHVDAFQHHLSKQRYAAETVRNYLGCVAHFARWSMQRRIDIRRIDEEAVHRFLDEHMPHCDCASPVQHRRCDLRAALGHLLVVLRASGAIAQPTLETTPVDEELERFDHHMNHVRGLAPKTRSMCLRIVRRLLLERFAGRAVVISAIKPDAVRGFIASQGRLYKKPADTGVVASALRGYFRFRASCGDQVHHLIGVVTYPANWQLASLPKALSSAEAERLEASLNHEGPSGRRTDAMVRCALDVGLRRSEIAKLQLDDIDWRAGTVTLRRTKSRREDVLPLPAATGRAIAEYLKFERPQTTNRAVFVRHVAPYDKPIGPDVVRQAIRRAYARAGLPYTRSHLLRHTLASRLLEGGSSLKEVADVLRHRSLNTTLIYAKLDSRNLAAVALPWPGCAA